jgi:hypothetical protein
MREALNVEVAAMRFVFALALLWLPAAHAARMQSAAFQSNYDDGLPHRYAPFAVHIGSIGCHGYSTPAVIDTTISSLNVPLGASEYSASERNGTDTVVMPYAAFPMSVRHDHQHPHTLGLGPASDVWHTFRYGYFRFALDHVASLLVLSDENPDEWADFIAHTTCRREGPGLCQDDDGRVLLPEGTVVPPGSIRVGGIELPNAPTHRISHETTAVGLAAIGCALRYDSVRGEADVMCDYGPPPKSTLNAACLTIALMLFGLHWGADRDGFSLAVVPNILSSHPERAHPMATIGAEVAGQLTAIFAVAWNMNCGSGLYYYGANYGDPRDNFGIAAAILFAVLTMTIVHGFLIVDHQVNPTDSVALRRAVYEPSILMALWTTLMEGPLRVYYHLLVLIIGIGSMVSASLCVRRARRMTRFRSIYAGSALVQWIFAMGCCFVPGSNSALDMMGPITRVCCSHLVALGVAYSTIVASRKRSELMQEDIVVDDADSNFKVA